MGIVDGVVAQLPSHDEKWGTTPVRALDEKLLFFMFTMESSSSGGGNFS